MEEFKGTKGEWYIENKKGINEFGSFGTDISSFYQRQFITIWGVNDKDEESESNAKLISAAPELLKALQMFVDFVDKQKPEYESSMVKLAKQAIQKALK